MALLAKHRSRVLGVTLSEPARCNPVTLEIAAELLNHLTSAEADEATRSVLLHGVERTFSSGGDLRAMPPGDAAVADTRLPVYTSLVTAMAQSRLPLVCAIEGTAAGIALGVATACDFIVSADDARSLLPFTRLGLFPDGGLQEGLAARVGHGRARALLLLGDSVSAAEAYNMELVDRHTPPGADAVAVAHRVASDLAALALLSVSGIKQRFTAGVHDLFTALEMARTIQSDLYFSSDFLEGPGRSSRSVRRASPVASCGESQASRRASRPALALTGLRRRPPTARSARPSGLSGFEPQRQ